MNVRYYARFIFVLALLAFPAVSAMAAPLGQAQLLTQPDHGLAGSWTTVQGSGWQAGVAVQIDFDGQAITTTQPSSAGDIHAPYQIPATATLGSHTFHAFNTKKQDVSSTFTVMGGPPSLTISPTSGLAGVGVTLSGQGLPADSHISLTFDDQAFATPTSSALGAVTGAYTIPMTTKAGAHLFAAWVGHEQYASATFTVLPVPSITLLDPNKGAPGSTIIVLGQGFGASEVVAITWPTVPPTVLITTTAFTGSIFANVTIPAAAAAGIYNITATGESTGNVAQAPFTVIPGLSLNLTTGHPGDAIMGLGVGFHANVSVTLTVLAHKTQKPLGTGTTNVNGSVTIPFTVPALSTGTYKLLASESDSRFSASTTLFVLAPPTITIQPNAGTEGTTFEVDGVGFGAIEQVDIRWVTASGSKVVDTATTGGTGAFTGFVVVPRGASQVAKVVVTGKTSGLTASGSYTVLGFLTISPSQGHAGSKVNVSASNFQIKMSYRVAWGAPSFHGMTYTPLFTETSTTSGTLSGSFIVPNVQLGNYTVAVLDASGAVLAETPYEVTAAH